MVTIDIPGPVSVIANEIHIAANFFFILFLMCYSY